jgi:hypothetical protein
MAEVRGAAQPVLGRQHRACLTDDVRQTAGRGPCGGGRREWRDRRECACADGNRGSWRGGDCSAGTYACSLRANSRFDQVAGNCRQLLGGADTCRFNADTYCVSAPRTTAGRVRQHRPSTTPPRLCRQYRACRLALNCRRVDKSLKLFVDMLDTARQSVSRQGCGHAAMPTRRRRRVRLINGTRSARRGSNRASRPGRSGGSRRHRHLPACGQSSR